jgi:hypothetical protein
MMPDGLPPNGPRECFSSGVAVRGRRVTAQRNYGPSASPDADAQRSARFRIVFDS